MHKGTLVFLFMIVLCTPCFAQFNETLTIATYYPSPNGVYRTLRLHPGDEPTTGVDRGSLYYNDTENVIRYRNDTQWVALGGGNGTGYWAKDPATNAINNTNPGMVMIDGVPGANGELFHINGDTRIYSQPQAAGEGSILYMERDYDGVTQHHNTIAFVNHDGSPGYGVQHIGNPGSLRLIGGPNGAYFNYVVMQNNMVGIGTSNPQQRLDVNGNVNASGNVNVGGSLFTGCRRLSQDYASAAAMATCYCPVGVTVISGGCHVPTSVIVSGSHPVYDGTTGRWGWECNRSPAGVMTVDALCCKIDVQ